MEITCKCAGRTDLCPLCVRNCDQYLTCNPLLNGLTMERHIDLGSRLAPWVKSLTLGQRLLR